MGILKIETSATGFRTRVARVRAEYPNQLDYSGLTALFAGQLLRMQLDAKEASAGQGCEHLRPEGTCFSREAAPWVSDFSGHQFV